MEQVMAEAYLPLSEFVRALRQEIVASAAAARDEAIKFELGPIELEFSVVATREAGVNGKISFQVLGSGFEIGGDGKGSAVRTQRVKLTLSPKQKDEDGLLKPIDISGQVLGASDPPPT
jgi:hypothetical protein